VLETPTSVALLERSITRTVVTGRSRWAGAAGRPAWSSV